MALLVNEGWRTGRETFAIVEISTDALLGGIGIRVPEWPVTDLGYWVASSARGRGIAVRAVQLLAAWAFDRLGSVRVEITTDVANRASQQVAEEAGFSREGVLRQKLEVKDRRSTASSSPSFPPTSRGASERRALFPAGDRAGGAPPGAGLSAVEVMEAHLAQIERGPQVNAIVTSSASGRWQRRAWPTRATRRGAARSSRCTQGSQRHRRHPDDLRLADLPEMDPGRVLPDRRAAPRSRRDRRGQDERARVQGRLPDVQRGVRGYEESYALDRTCGGSSGAPPSRSRAAWCRSPMGATWAARCATPRRSATSSGSVRARAAFRPGRQRAALLLSVDGSDGPDESPTSLSSSRRSRDPIDGAPVARRARRDLRSPFRARPSRRPGWLERRRGWSSGRSGRAGCPRAGAAGNLRTRLRSCRQLPGHRGGAGDLPDTAGRRVRAGAR